jgi:dihydroxycyclohexadiene carboxylate dehydrogenase
MMTHPERFAGKVAVVTGAAQGIGRNVALRISREGAAVALVDRSALIHDVEGEIEGSIAVTADLETFDGACRAMDAALSRFGRIDVLINNVGVPISYYAARDGVDIDLLTRGAGFGYIGPP